MKIYKSSQFRRQLADALGAAERSPIAVTRSGDRPDMVVMTMSEYESLKLMQGENGVRLKESTAQVPFATARKI